MNARDNISGLSRELVLLAISFTAEDLQLFRTGLCQRGGHFARISRIDRKHLPDVRAKFQAPFSR
jgi:hypothetical protein